MKLSDIRPCPSIKSDAHDVIEHLIYSVAEVNDILKSECNKFKSLIDSLEEHIHSVTMKGKKYLTVENHQTIQSILIELKICYFKSLFEVTYDPSMDDYDLMIDEYNEVSDEYNKNSRLHDIFEKSKSI